jgi:hypothetical protein
VIAKPLSFIDLVFVGVPELQVQLSCACPAFVEDQAVHAVGKVREGDLASARLMPMVQMNSPI